MSIRIDIPDASGQYIEVKDVSEINHGDKKAARGAVSVTVDPLTGKQSYPGDMDDSMRDALAARIITGWNLQWPLPKGDARVLENLSSIQYAALKAGVAAHVAAVNEDVDPSKAGTDPTVASAI